MMVNEADFELDPYWNQFSTTRLEILDAGKATVAKLEVSYEGITDVFFGWAKKHPEDTVNPLVGKTVALKRLFEGAAKHYAKVADLMVETNCEDVKTNDRPT